jgi:hypothetical protein
MNEILATMMSWAILLTGYPAPAALPEMAMVPHSYLDKAACYGHKCKVLGWFPPGRTIYLDARLDPQASLYASSVLLHELVHYLQQESGKYGKPSCEAAMEMEREAYAVQREYFVRYGVYQPLGFSMHAVGCERAVHQD